MIELFTFLRSGGSLDRIVMAPIEESLPHVLRRFASFDAAHARCFLETDRQSLLSVLEAGFGNLEAFVRRP